MVLNTDDERKKSHYWNRYCMNTLAIWWDRLVKTMLDIDESLVCCETGWLRKLRSVTECGLLQATCHPHISSDPLEVKTRGGCCAPELEIMSFASLHLFNRRPTTVGWVNKGPWMLEYTCSEIDFLCRTGGQQSNTKMHLTTNNV